MGLKPTSTKPPIISVDQRIGAFLDNLLNLNPGLLCEQHRGKIIDGSGTRRRDLKWLLGSLHQGDQFADRVNRQVAVYE